MTEGKRLAKVSTEDKKSTNPDLLYISQTMRSLRLDAGIDQHVMAQRLGISRKKLSQIENCYSSVMEGFEMTLFQKCFDICRGYIPEQSRVSFKEKLLKFFHL